MDSLAAVNRRLLLLEDERVLHGLALGVRPALSRGEDLAIGMTCRIGRMARPTGCQPTIKSSLVCFKPWSTRIGRHGFLLNLLPLPLRQPLPLNKSPAANREFSKTNRPTRAKAATIAHSRAMGPISETSLRESGHFPGRPYLAGCPKVRRELRVDQVRPTDVRHRRPRCHRGLMGGIPARTVPLCVSNL